MSEPTAYPPLDIPPQTTRALTQPEWERHVECAYDTLPSWWWSPAERRVAYNQYLQHIGA